MKRAFKVSNFYGEVHFKQIQRLTILFTGNTLPRRKQSRKGAEEASQLIRKGLHLTGFHTIRPSTEQFFRTDLKNLVQIPST